LIQYFPVIPVFAYKTIDFLCKAAVIIAAIFWFFVNKTAQKFLAWMLVLLVIAMLLQLFFSTVISLEKTGLSREYVVAVISVMVAIGSLLLTKILDQKFALTKYRTDKIFLIYEKTFDFLFELQYKQVHPYERREFIDKMEKEIFKWGSFKLKKLWSQTKLDLQSQDFHESEKLIEFLLAIRQEIGLPTESKPQIRRFFNWKEPDTSGEKIGRSA
jgi:hypothetical protein